MRAVFGNDTPSKRANTRADIKDVTARVMAHLLGVSIPNPALISEEVIIIANDLTPSDTAQLNRQYVKGFATDIGGRTSHSAIMARSLEIPAVVGTKDITSRTSHGDIIVLDGTEGDVILNPSDEDLTYYKNKQAEFAKQKELRSEERRVGKERRTQWRREEEKKKEARERRGERR